MYIHMHTCVWVHMSSEKATGPSLIWHVPGAAWLSRFLSLLPLLFFHLSLHICCALFLYPPSARLSVCVSAFALVCVLLLSQTDFATHPVPRTAAAAKTTTNLIISSRGNNNNVIIDVVVGVCRVYTEIRKIHLWLSYPFCCCCLRCRCCFVPVSGRRPRRSSSPSYVLVLLLVVVSASVSASACSNFSCVRPTSPRIAGILETAAFFSSPKQGAPLDRLLRLLDSAEVDRMGTGVDNQRVLMGASNGYWWVCSMSIVGYICLPLPQMSNSAVSESLYGCACVCVCVYDETVLRSSFKMKEHEENGNGKKMGNKLRHVLWNDEIFSSSLGLLRFHFGFSLNFSNSFTFKVHACFFKIIYSIIYSVFPIQLAIIY